MNNVAGEKLIIGYDKENNQFYIDRTHSGTTDFDKDFAGIYTAPRLSEAKTNKLTLVVDAA